MTLTKRRCQYLADLVLVQLGNVVIDGKQTSTATARVAQHRRESRGVNIPDESLQQRSSA